ncbi:MAG: hypothetical protein GIW97_00805 [Candidatus Eremiobacteraeota bacterium]|nr:hypothetical protein [Candidatus Eremiobacteraeota bacterium]
MAFFEKPFVSRVKRRIDIRILKFCRSTCDAEMNRSSGSPLMGNFRRELQTRDVSGWSGAQDSVFLDDVSLFITKYATHRNTFATSHLTITDRCEIIGV